VTAIEVLVVDNDEPYGIAQDDAEPPIERAPPEVLKVTGFVPAQGLGGQALLRMGLITALRLPPKDPVTDSRFPPLAGS